MFSFIKSLTAFFLFFVLYYFFYKRPTSILKEQFDVPMPDLPKCQTLNTEALCDDHGAYCNYDKTQCISNCNRKKCDNIKNEIYCNASSTTSNQQTEPACVWKSNKCNNCPWDYVMPDPVTKDIKCFYNRCDRLPKEICESPLFSSTCCWNVKTKKCECRSKKEDPLTKQCV